MTYTLKDIAVFFDDSADARHLLATSASLACQQDAHLIGVTTEHGEDARKEDGFARGNGMASVIRKHQQTTAQHLSTAGHLLETASEAQGVGCELRVIPAMESANDTVLQALSCDLLVVSAPATVNMPFANASVHFLERTGLPLLVVPTSWEGKAVGVRIVVAWNATRQARRAISDAMPLLALAESVDLLIVDPESKPGAYGEEPGADMAAHLARHGVKVTLQRISSDGRPVADAVLAHAIDSDADLIVAGTGSRAKLIQAVFGGVTRSLLAKRVLPVFISH